MQVDDSHANIRSSNRGWHSEIPVRPPPPCQPSPNLHSTHPYTLRLDPHILQSYLNTYSHFTVSILVNGRERLISAVELVGMKRGFMKFKCQLIRPTGQATLQLHQFDEIIGIDPSAGMAEKARISIDRNQSVDAGKFTFKQGSAEDFSTTIPEDNSVDLMIAGISWLSILNRNLFLTSALVKLKRRIGLIGKRFGRRLTAYWNLVDLLLSGFVSFVTYARPAQWDLWHFFVDLCRDSTTPISKLKPQDYRFRPRNGCPDESWSTFPKARSHNPRATPYRCSWTIDSVESRRPPTSSEGIFLWSAIFISFCQHMHIAYESVTGDEQPHFLPNNALKHPVIMQKEMRWRDLLAYFRTWSSLHTYHERYPEDLKREEDVRFLQEDLATCTEPQG